MRWLWPLIVCALSACTDGNPDLRGGKGDASPGDAAADAALACTPGVDEQRACGLNGRGSELRTCPAGTWGVWGACEDPDTCADGAFEEDPSDCAAGVRHR